MSDAPNSEPGVPGSPAAGGLASASGSAESKKPRRRFFPRFSLRSLTLCVLLAASGLGLWWKWEPWYPQYTTRLSDEYQGVSKSTPDKTKLLVQLGTAGIKGAENLSYKVLSLPGLKEICTIQQPEGFGSEGFDEKELTTDGRWVIFRFAMQRHDSVMVSTDTGRCLYESSDSDPVLRQEISKDCSRMLLIYEKKKPEIWDLKAAAKLTALEVGPDAVWDGAISPDGRWVALVQTRDSNFVAYIEEAMKNGATADLVDGSMTYTTVLDVDSRKTIRRIYGSNYPDWVSGQAEILIVHRTGNKTAIDLLSGSEVAIDDAGYLSEAVPGVVLWSTDDGTYALNLVNGKKSMVMKGFLPHELKQNVLDRTAISNYAEGWEEGTIDLPSAPILKGFAGGISPPRFAEGPWVLTVCAWDLDSGEERWRCNLDLTKDEYPKNMKRSAKGRWLTVETLDGWTITKTWLIRAERGAKPAQYEGRIRISPDENRLLQQSLDGGLVLIDLLKSEKLYTWTEESYEKSPFVGPQTDFEFLTEYQVLLEDSAGSFTVWHRRRPEQWWGVAWLAEFWLTLVFALLLGRSLVRDFKTLRKKVAGS